jgi:amidophosphoribosyltransferase
MSEMTETPSDAGLDLDGDRLREECGVFGIFGHPDAAAITALGLHAPSGGWASSATISPAAR